MRDLIHDATRLWDRDKVFDLLAHKTRMEILLPICFGPFVKESFKNVQMLLKISSCYLGG